MKKTALPLLLMAFLMVSTALFAQVVTPVKWKFSTDKVTVKNGDKVTVSFKATIDDGWHLYSNRIPENGPVPTSFTFNETKGVKKLGSIKTNKTPKSVYDESFAMNLEYFESGVTFSQQFEITDATNASIKGVVEFMTCDDQRCLPPSEEDFAFSYKPSAEVVAVQPEKISTPLPTTDTVKETIVAVANSDTEKPVQPKADEIKSAKDKTPRSLGGFFWVAFLSGLAAIFTPCVFPMIPMTVSYFIKGSKSIVKGRINALFYGGSIIGIYTLVGTFFAVTFGANFANFLSTHWIPNVLFFVVFMVFAASFFGAFEMTMPGWLVNKSTANEDKGGFSGIFFMAFTLVLVSFSCTGPIVGMILVASAGGEIITPIVGMLGFSLAFALPFTVFALFPQLMNKMPKSGGWLNSVKVVLGFIEVALGLKFLSIADQTYHWGILDREIYLAIWIVVFALLGFYLLGKLKFSHDSEVKHIGVFRLFLAITTFSFVMYMIPGMFGAPLKALSGYLPPATSQDFDLNRIIQENAPNGAMLSDQSNEICSKPKYSENLHLPLGLKGYFDYEQALACAKEKNKPVFIDFTGHGCVNCREMESRVWSDPQVLKRLREDYVVVALYVDDKTKLPENEWITSKVDGKQKKTIGQKYADFQISKFQVNSQPYYVLLSPDGELLEAPRAYNLNIDEFVSFLDAGKKKMTK